MPIDFDRHLAAESDRFLVAVLAARSGARVPACPDWDADDLLWHLGHVQAFWADILRNRPAAPDDDQDEPERPADRVGLVSFYEASTADLRTLLAEAADDEPAWTWHATEHTVGFIRRRQAHEALIHRVDAEQAAQSPTPLDPELAADGVLECLDWMYAGKPAWGTFTPGGGSVAVETTDTGDRFLVGLGRFAGHDPRSDKDVDDVDIVVTRDADAPAEATIRGAAAALDLWLWHRRDAEGLTREGEQAPLAALDGIVAQAVD